MYSADVALRGFISEASHEEPTRSAQCPFGLFKDMEFG